MDAEITAKITFVYARDGPPDHREAAVSLAEPKPAPPRRTLASARKNS